MRYLMVRPWVFSWWPWATSWWDPWVFSWSPWATSWRDHEFSHGHHELAHGREVMWNFFVTMRYLMVSHQKIYLMVGKWCKKNWPPPHHEVGSWSRGETMSYLMVTTRYLMVSWLGSDVKFCWTDLPRSLKHYMSKILNAFEHATVYPDIFFFNIGSFLFVSSARLNLFSVYI